MASDKSSTQNAPVSRFVSGLSSLVLLQATSRLITFALNQALVRLASPQVFGTAAIQFELLLSSTLFLSREGVRVALLRTPLSKPKVEEDGSHEKVDTADLKPTAAPSRKASQVTRRKQSQPAPPAEPSTNEEQSKKPTPRLTAADDSKLASNISLLPFLAGIPLSVVFATFYYISATEEAAAQPNFPLAIIIYVIAAIAELSSEPLYVRAQTELAFSLRVKAEGAAVMAKTVMTFIVLVGAPASFALVAFAMGQLAYGVTTLAVYWQAYKYLPEYWPEKVTKTIKDQTVHQRFDGALLKLSMAMTLQSIVKHFLTEADKFAVSQMSQLADQGGYAVASNYGSLVARIVFQPIEEITRVWFSKTLAECTVEQENVPRDALEAHLKRTQQPKTYTASKSQTLALESASKMLSAILLLQSHLALLFLTFFPPYIPVLLHYFLPTRYKTTSAPQVLQTYGYYLPIMSLNGVLEACSYSIMGPNDLKIAARWMFGFSILFMVSSATLVVFLSNQRESALVWANILNLGLRAWYAWWVITGWFTKYQKRELVSFKASIPPIPVLLAFALSAILTRLSRNFFGIQSFTNQVYHVSIGVACIAVCLGICYRTERASALALVSYLKKH